MPFPILGGKAIVDEGFDVANSCRFNRADSPKHEKALGTSTDDKKHTFSCWFKKCENSVSSSEHGLMNSATDSNNFVNCMFHSSDTFQYFAKIGGSTAMQLKTSSLFRDPSAWYHIVVGVDTSQSTDTNRVKIYINGTQVTSWVTETYPDQDAVLDTNESGADIQIGCMRGPDHYFHGYMAEVVFIDGLQYAASDFGEFNEDSPTIWQPKDVSGLTFGTNGFYLDFEASDNLGNDANGGTDLDETNIAAIDQCVDSPTNNFCTMNSLDNYIPGSTFLEGNCVITSQSTGYQYNTGTFGLTAGKWYYEMKMTENAQADIVGIAGRVSGSSLHYLGYYDDGWGYHSYDGKYKNDNTGTTYGDTWVTNDTIVGVYIDLDNNKLYFSKNGTIQNSGTGISITDPASVSDGAYFPAVGDNWNAETGTYHMNFGNPTYTGTDQADANGYGSFEYDPSDGGNSSFDSAAKDFLAICSKNLGSDGG